MSALDLRDRERLAALADLLIPASDGMPSGSSAQAHNTYLDSVFAVRPDLVEVVRAGLDVLPDPVPAALAEVPMPQLRPVADALTAAYFLNPDVAASVGYRKRSVIPIRFDDDLDGLVADVVARGTIYRPTPGTEES
ncbi:hypothetical protein [Microbacterium sp. CJ88]|uniref:hypothetical protein n=1 Tax=Microbacterium sp. CJ88 TaxID=3445672 RepID=UPI003F655E46